MTRERDADGSGQDAVDVHATGGRHTVSYLMKQITRSPALRIGAPKTPTLLAVADVLDCSGEGVSSVVVLTPTLAAVPSPNIWLCWPAGGAVKNS
jgi:hypothetical protein